MISVEEAKSIVRNSLQTISRKKQVTLLDACGLCLAENIVSEHPLPPFNQSNVDGYAVADLSNGNWKVIGEIKAGDVFDRELKPGEAVRIFTGACVPPGASAIAMQEFTSVENAQLTLNVDYALKNGEHIRLKGSHIQAGTIALEAGIVLNAAALSFIAMLGLDEVSVFDKPRVHLILTGNELQAPGTPPEAGKIYESNSIALGCALKELGLEINQCFLARDEKQLLQETVTLALEDCDLLLISGGISVGDYDFVREVLDDLGTECLFHKIAQKPGKPLYFGRNKTTAVFGLPGNPASALTCFYEYVVPVLQGMQGQNAALFLPKETVPIQSDYSKKPGLAHFLKAQRNENGVILLEGQESFIMKSFAQANALIYFPKESEGAKAGDLVEIHALPPF